MITFTHYDDGKHKLQSHEISIMEDAPFYNADLEIFSHDPFDLVGYGSTKEEAIEDFKRKFYYLMDEWKAFEAILSSTCFETDETIEVDCFGKPIGNSK